MIKSNCAWGDDIQVYLWLQNQNLGACRSMRSILS